jgi:hypothetical protein
MEGAKFCPQCGDPVTEEDIAKKPIAKNSASKIEIVFGSSSSSNFDPALEVCGNIPTFAKKGDGKDALYSVILESTEVELAITIWELVGNWKSSKMSIDGQRITKSDLVYNGLGCYRNRQKAFEPNQYCYGEREFEYNIWGCKRLNMPIHSWGGWLDNGKFDSRGVWYFDKEKIKHELELAIHENKYCPILSREKVLETLEGIPDSIDPKTNENWEYRTQYDYNDGNPVDKAVGIRPVMNKASEYVVGNYKPILEEENAADVSEKTVYDIKIDLNNIHREGNEDLDSFFDEKQQKNRDRTVIVVVAVIIIIYLIATFF